MAANCSDWCLAALSYMSKFGTSSAREGMGTIPSKVQDPTSAIANIRAVRVASVPNKTSEIAAPL
jgi:hypothetical protein